MKAILKQHRKIGSFVMVIALIGTLILPAMNVKAALEYRVIFRGGSKGTVEGSSNAARTAAYGDKISAPDVMIKTEYTGLYYFTGWKEDPSGVGISEVDSGGVIFWETDPIERNVEFVAQYKQITDAVEYRIRYIDQTTLEEIAPTVISQTQDGTNITASPITIANYTAQTASYSIMVKKTNSVNELVFKYTGAATEVITQTQYSTGAGTTTTEETINYVTGGAATTAGGGAATTVIPEEEVPLAEGEEEVATQEETAVTEEEPGGGETTIEEEEVPLAEGTEEEEGLGLLPILAGITGALAIALGFIWFAAKRKKKTEGTDTDSLNQP